jgi:iron complex transport system substrate-binding protein
VVAKLNLGGFIRLVNASLLSALRLNLRFSLPFTQGFKNYNLRIVILAIATTMLIAACHNTGLKPEQQKTDLSSCHIVKHSMGETCVPNHIEKVVTLYTPPLASVLALGIKPVGITPATGALDEFPPYLQDKVVGIEIVANVNDEPNLEKILHLKPDLILGWDFHEKVYPLLSQIAPTLLSQPNHKSARRDEWEEYFSFIGQAIGKKSESQNVLARYHKRIVDMRTALGEKYADKTISVAHVSHEFGMETYASNSFPGSILSALKLQRPETQDVIIQDDGRIESISAERLDLIDGDILFAMNFSEDDQEMLENFLKQPLWKKLRAVLKNQIYPVDGWTWVVSNPLSANAVIDDLYKYLIKGL